MGFVSNFSHLNITGVNQKVLPTCAVDRDDTAYLAVDRVLQLPTEQYGCRYLTHARLKEVTVKSRGLLYIFFCQNLLARYFSFLRKVLAN